MDLIERAAEHLRRQSGNFPDQLPVSDGQVLRPEPDVEVLGDVSDDALGFDHSVAFRKPERSLEPAASPHGPRLGRSVELDFTSFEANGILLPFGKNTPRTEEFRHIKRDVLNLRNVDGLANSNLVMVTSAVPGEGKTHTAINLAMSIATERDLTALLIDADVTRPRVMQRLGISSDKGLIDLLDDPGLDVSDVILRTNVETLSIIPAGPRHQRSTELLSSQRMHRVAEEISKRYDDRIVIFDTAPLLATTEPAALLKHVGQILVVVEAEKTSKGALSSAMEIIKGHRGVGFVLNKVRPQLGNALTGNYYGYQGYQSYDRQ